MFMNYKEIIEGVQNEIYLDNIRYILFSIGQGDFFTDNQIHQMIIKINEILDMLDMNEEAIEKGQKQFEKLKNGLQNLSFDEITLIAKIIINGVRRTEDSVAGQKLETRSSTYSKGTIKNFNY